MNVLQITTGLLGVSFFAAFTATAQHLVDSSTAAQNVAEKLTPDRRKAHIEKLIFMGFHASGSNKKIQKLAHAEI